MEKLIPIFIIIPFLGFIVNAFIEKDDEKKLSQVSFLMMAIQLGAVILFNIVWIYNGCPHLYEKQLTLFKFDNFDLYLDFSYDWTTAIFLFIGTYITFLITSYSRNYLHRESGFKRFFFTILFFYLGYNVIVLSYNLTTIFVGWEMVGISSFLLIAYYRNRFLPVKNAVKIFSLYRLGDVCILLAMWFSHHIWHFSINLSTYMDEASVLEHINQSPGYSIGFALCIIVAAAIKSAQFPFSTWLPRAMEGPTPSSAIFYSSLAVHLGLLFLMRTYSFWVHVPYMQALVIFSGVFGFIFSTITSRIQPSIKGQIAYAIVAQVGIMIIEVALGWHTLVLVHFASHALLRSYQLLISPSIVSYAIKKQFFEFKKPKKRKLPGFIRNISNSIYILSLNEWYLDKILYFLVWGMFEKLGGGLNQIPETASKILNQIVWIIVPIVALMLRSHTIEYNVDLLSAFFLFLALFYVLKIFTQKKRASVAWQDIASLHILLASGLAVDNIPFWHLSFYIGGVILSYFIGYYALEKIREKEEYIELESYQGHCYEYPKVEFFFLLSCLGLMGFPITSAFIGVELLFNGIHEGQYVQLFLLSVIFFINGLSMVRMYARIFLGPHVKTYHETARKSS